ncbi:MAG: UDP-glucose 4-epimerase [Paracoccaceae bacterium]|jgi:UDP-glucose 4-epimerase
MFQSKKVLVTGSAGFIGSHLVESLKDQCGELICIDINNGQDLCDSSFVDNLPDVDVIFHLAAKNGTRWFYDEPFSVLENCTTPTLNLIRRYKNSGALFVYASSCEIYADATEVGITQVPTNEEVSVLFNDPRNLRWSYAAGKYIGELAVISAAKEFGLDYVVLRYHNIYGPRQVDHFIPEFYERVQRGDCSLKGWRNTRAFCYISDAVEMTIRAACDESAKNRIIHIGDDKEVTIKEVAEIILSFDNIKSELLLHDAPEGSASRRCPDVTLAKSLGIYHQSVSLEAGLKRTIKDLT